MNNPNQTMRDVFIERLYERMKGNKKIFFLCADFGAPALDKIRKAFPGRFINVGIAEQNLINVATGLALEGYAVFAYAISPFITMRAYEQSRVNLSLLSQTKPINVNLIGVGAGVSYSVSGPTHHCLEDIILMRLLPNFSVYSPSDSLLASHFTDLCIKTIGPKYLRFDAKLLPRLYNGQVKSDWIEKGFKKLKSGKRLCLISTGYMTHTALKVAELAAKDNLDWGVLDIFRIKPFNQKDICATLKKYEYAVTLEEAFVGKGGLDTAVLTMINENNLKLRFKSFGFQDRYEFALGGRDRIHFLNGLDALSILKSLKKFIKT